MNLILKRVKSQPILKSFQSTTKVSESNSVKRSNFETSKNNHAFELKLKSYFSSYKFEAGFIVGGTLSLMIASLGSFLINNRVKKTQINEPANFQKHTQQSVSNVLTKCNPAVVCIRLHNGNSIIYEQSGFLIHSNGFILSTAIEPAIFDKLSIKTQDGRIFPVSTVEYDGVNGLCLIKITSKQNIQFPFIEMLSKLDEPANWGDMIVSFGAKDSDNCNKFSVGHLQHQEALKKHQCPLYVSEMKFKDNFSEGGPLVNMNGKAIGINRTQLKLDMKYQNSIPIEYAEILLHKALYKSRFAASTILDYETGHNDPDTFPDLK